MDPCPACSTRRNSPRTATGALSSGDRSQRNLNCHCYCFVWSWTPFWSSVVAGEQPCGSCLGTDSSTSTYCRSSSTRGSNFVLFFSLLDQDNGTYEGEEVVSKSNCTVCKSGDKCRRLSENDSHFDCHRQLLKISLNLIFHKK